MAISQITSNSIAAGAVSASDLADGSITTDKLANSAVTTTKISATGTPSSSTFLRGDGSWQAVSIPANSVSSSSLTSTGRITYLVAERNTQQSLGGDSGWVDHVSVTFTVGVASRIMFWMCTSVGYESGAVQGFMRFILDGNQVGSNFCAGRQAASNQAASGSATWYADVSAGSHTLKVQARNSIGGTTWITPYWSVDGQSVNTLGVMYYA